jgi:hypothetical protein
VCGWGGWRIGVLTRWVSDRWVSDCLCQVFTPNPFEYIIESASEQEREREKVRERAREATTKALWPRQKRASTLTRYNNTPETRSHRNPKTNPNINSHLSLSRLISVRMLC